MGFLIWELDGLFCIGNRCGKAIVKWRKIGLKFMDKIRRFYRRKMVYFMLFFKIKKMIFFKSVYKQTAWVPSGKLAAFLRFLAPPQGQKRRQNLYFNGILSIDESRSKCYNIVNPNIIPRQPNRAEAIEGKTRKEQPTNERQQPQTLPKHTHRRRTQAANHTQNGRASTSRNSNNRRPCRVPSPILYH